MCTVADIYCICFQQVTETFLDSKGLYLKVCNQWIVCLLSKDKKLYKNSKSAVSKTFSDYQVTLTKGTPKCN